MKYLVGILWIVAACGTDNAADSGKETQSVIAEDVDKEPANEEDKPLPWHNRYGKSCPTADSPRVLASYIEEEDRKYLMTIVVGDKVSGVLPEVREILFDTSRVYHSTLANPECPQSESYTYSATGGAAFGSTNFAFSFKFYLCEGIVDRIDYCI